MNHSGDIPTEASGGIADTGVAAFVQFSSRTSRRDAPALPPEEAAAYTKKSQENVGVMAMRNLLIMDLDDQGHVRFGRDHHGEMEESSPLSVSSAATSST